LSELYQDGREVLTRLPWVTTCSACRTQNAPGARFCSARGTPLATLCVESGVPLPDDARFCSACGASVIDAGAAPSNERKLVTVLFADVTGGFEHEHRDLRSVLVWYFAWSGQVSTARSHQMAFSSPVTLLAV
jgi:hypothetical protein